MLQNILRNKKTSGLILGGLAAYAFYKYSKMGSEEKSKFTQSIKDTFKDLVGQVLPGSKSNGTSSTPAHSSYAETPVTSGSF